MLQSRVIPCLLLQETGLVKTIKFKKPNYIGDPINAVRIFNDKEVDEMVFLDISATPQKRGPNFELIRNIASEAFMPFAYGGGITNINQIEKLFKAGVEKIVLNTATFFNYNLIKEAANNFGNQSIVASIDYKYNLFGKPEVYVKCGKKNTKLHPLEYAIHMEQQGAGEILLNSIDRDGTFKGYDIKLIRKISQSIGIPLVACGGAASMNDFKVAINEGNATAVAAGSMFVYQGIHKAVLITYPSQKELELLN